MQTGVAEDDEVLDTETQEETEVPEGEPQGEPEGEESEAPAEEAGEEEDVIQIGDEAPPASEEDGAAPKWVKELRQRQKELARENAELRAKLQVGQPAQGKPQLPAKPKLADFDYDEDRYEQARDAWDAKKREVDAWQESQQKALQEQQKAAQAIEDNYAKSKAALKVKDYQTLEDAVAASFDPVQQALVKQGAANPALMVAALGSSPKKLQELASIKDPVKFAVALGKLETEVKVTKRTSTKPAPETAVRGTGGSPSTSKATLDRLEAEAERTGDRSKVIAYKRQTRNQGK